MNLLYQNDKRSVQMVEENDEKIEKKIEITSINLIDNLDLINCYSLLFDRY